MMNKIFDKSKWLLAFVCFTVLMSCGDTYESSIPSVRFNLTYNTSVFPTITTPGYFVKVERNINGISVGYAGLLLGKSLLYSEMGDNNYTCYDAACPVEAQKGVSINLIEGELGKAVCPKCETVYDLNNYGFPTGVGKEYLKRYPVSVNGTTLIVQN